MYVEQSPLPGKCPGLIRGLCTRVRPRVSPSRTTTRTRGSDEPHPDNMLALLTNSATAFSLGGAPVHGASARVQRHTAVVSLNSRRQFLGTSAAALAATITAAPTYAAPKNSVSFSNVKDGDTVPSTFTYKLEVTGYGLSPAADGPKPGTGHHHLIIDGPGAFVPPGEVIPMDATHKHYGKAQTEGTLELEPGKHKITMQFANHLHESYGKEFAKTITVNVKADA